MILFQIWATISGIILLLLMIKTIRFNFAIESLKDVLIDEENNRTSLQKNSQALQKSAKTKNSHSPSSWPKISFIVPACNEEQTIKAAAESLLDIDYPNLEIVIVNDRSTDNTGKIADRFAERDSRLKVLHITELPEGWLGKVHALDRGISMTKSEWILLADADIHFNSDAIKKAITYCQNKKIDFLTAVPDIKSKSSSLQILIAQLFHQASLFFSPKRLNDPKQKTCYGQGAFMLLNRAMYDRSEGMQWLRMEVIDDTGLAVMMRRAGARMGAVAGKDEIQLEWYPDVAAYFKGVEKNAFAFCQYNWLILFGLGLTNWLFVLGFSLAPVFSGNSLIQGFCAFSLLGYLGAIYFQMKKLLDLRFWQVCMFPIAVLILPVIFVRAATLSVINKGIYWRGTFYSLVELKRNQRMKLANLVFSIDEDPNEEENDKRKAATKYAMEKENPYEEDSQLFALASYQGSTDKLRHC